MRLALWALSSWVWQRKESELRTLAQEEVYLAGKVKPHSKRRFELAAQRVALAFQKEGHRDGSSEPAGLHGLRKQITEAKEGPLEMGLRVSLGQVNAARCSRGCKFVKILRA